MTADEAREYRRSLQQMEAIYRARRRLFLVHLDLTWRCPLACAHCYLGPVPGHLAAELPAAAWIDFLREARRRQVVRVVISGGEPLVHPGFFQVLEACASLRFTVLVKTTGWHYREAAESLARVPFLSVDVSLHHRDPTRHDAFTGRPGSHQAAVLAIEDLAHRGIPVRVTRSLVQGIEDDGGALREWCDQRGVSLAESLTVLPVRSRGHDGPSSSRGFHAAALSADRQRPVLQRLLADRTTPPRAPGPDDPLCAAGVTRLYVDPTGRISPCVAWTRPLGHLREGLGAVLRGPALREVRRIRQRHRTGCRDCSLRAVCDFCPGLAEADTGDPVRPYPQACRKARLLGDLLLGNGEVPP